MNKAPAFPFYAKDFYTGTSDLSEAEAGTYARGLAWSWDNGPLPLDDKRRARVMLTTPAKFKTIWPSIAHLWNETPQGFTNDRLETERAKREKFHQDQAAKGQLGGRPKGHK